MENSNRPQSIFVSHKRENPYVNIDKTCLLDTSLSWKAKGILAYLLSLPSDWKVYADEISKHSTDGTKATSTGIKELMDKKYIHRRQLREKGKFLSYEYCVYEVPTESPFSENGKTENDFSENGKGHTTNYINKLNNNKLNNNINICSPIQDNTQTTSITSSKEIKHKYGEFNHVKLTDKEYSKLIEDFGEDKINIFIKKVDEYCEQYGKSYKNYNLTIRKWISNDKDNKNNFNKGGFKDVAAGYKFDSVRSVQRNNLDIDTENIDF